jgi:ABC-type transport system involved in multi-copper enzyme maturation permease subunit
MLGPIFTREWLTLPRQPRHFVQRSLFIGLLWVLVLTLWQTYVGWDRPATLGDQARFGHLTLQVLLLTQLVLALFFSALSSASAVALEKDRRTFLLLLMTDLHDYEIVLGKCLGSLLAIGLLLAGSLPVLFLLYFMGGFSPSQVMQGMAVVAATALAAGSLGSLIALWREKTFQSLSLTVLCLVLYLCVVRVLGFVGPEEWDDVQAWLDPFLALREVLDPDASAPRHAIAPSLGCGMTMLGLAVFLQAWGIWKLRVWNPSGEPIQGSDSAPAATESSSDIHASPGRRRIVWENPIAWREIRTRAYGRRPLLVKTSYFIVLALICWFALGDASSRTWAAALGLVPVVILSLLLVSAQAVTAITSERDLGALDLLMVTRLTPREFLLGKVAGILWNAKEFMLPPLVLIGVYAAKGKLGHPPTAGRLSEAALCLGVGFGVLVTFTVLLGIHVALRAANSRWAILQALGAVFFLSAGTILCIYLILITGRFEYQWLSFSGFLVVAVGGLWWVLCGDRPSTALAVASWLCPLAVFYTISNVLIGKPGRTETADPLLPFLVTVGAFGFASLSMLLPLLSEFEVAIGKASAGGGN